MTIPVPKNPFTSIEPISGEWRDRSMPAMRSALFSRAASAAASLSEACSESVKTEAPRIEAFGSASA